VFRLRRRTISVSGIIEQLALMKMNLKGELTMGRDVARIT
jgi:hypothetical protein